MAILFFTLLIVVLDQIAKLAIRSRFYLGESHEVLGNFLRFTYVQNPGIAFGIHFDGNPIFTIFAAIASVIIVIYLYRMRKSRFTYRLSLALILGGAIGNLLDRFAYGKVIDFIDLGIGTKRWPFVFNIADMGVTIGIVILISLVFLDKDEKQM
ncbi:MAG: signal peptidase II [candidate division KSB1 bacterium]|nr:signal peptidase II [candidate division KSB1 bacterium]MDZ7312547.1 signal peptidase II [candidate division KSB1 bacterium]